jgi:hypothetical protein
LIIRTRGGGTNSAVFQSAAGAAVANVTDAGAINGSQFQVGGTRVVTTRQAAVAAPAGGATIDTQARTAINDIIARLVAHGLIS